MQSVNGIIFSLNMSGEMHTLRWNEMFGGMLHEYGALSMFHGDTYSEVTVELSLL